jgi:hypothetical protein
MGFASFCWLCPALLMGFARREVRGERRGVFVVCRGGEGGEERGRGVGAEG